MSKENLTRTEAIAKLKELAEGIDFAIMATNLKNEPSHAVPMSTKKVDIEGNVWFLSSSESTHNKNIVSDSKTQLFYSNPSSMEFLTVYGDASISENKGVIKELYSKTDDAWFEGVEDPKITAIKVTPIETYYWDTKHGRLESLFKMGIGLITGEEQDLSEYGELKV